MTLMQRRRALTGAGQGSILFSWKPTDGLSKLTITASSGSPNYQLTSSLLNITLPANNTITTLIAVDANFSIPEKYKISVEYVGLNVITKVATQLAVTSRFDSRLNARAVLQQTTTASSRMITVAGQSTQLASIPTNGKLSCVYDKVNNMVYGYIDDVLKGQNSFSPVYSPNDGTIWCNSNKDITIGIKSITIERVD